MKIIKLGNKKKEDELIRETCYKCETVFEYTQKDVHSDLREGDYVICPNDECKAYITAQKPKS